MPEPKAETGIFDAAPAHPEEIRTEFDLSLGKFAALHGRVRITPAGLICSGLAVAMIGFGLGYLARSGARRRW